MARGWDTHVLETEEGWIVEYRQPGATGEWLQMHDDGYIR